MSMSITRGATGISITQTHLFFPALPLVHTAKHPSKTNHCTEQDHMISKQMSEARKYFSNSINFQISLSLTQRKN